MVDRPGLVGHGDGSVPAMWFAGRPCSPSLIGDARPSQDGFILALQDETNRYDWKRGTRVLDRKVPS